MAKRGLFQLTEKGEGEEVEETYIVLLRDKETDIAFPLYVDPCSYQQLTLVFENDVVVAAPITHQLVINLLSDLSVSVIGVEIFDLKEDAYLAAVVFEDSSGNILRECCRPTDGIAIAVSSGSPILVEERLIMDSAELEETKKILEMIDAYLISTGLK